MARALIARLKAADSSINRRDELWRAYRTPMPGIGQQRLAPSAGSHLPTACAWAMGR